MRYFVAVAAVAATAWLVRAYRRADSDALFVFDDRNNRVRRMVREEIKAADAEWDKHVTEAMAVGNPLGPIFGPAADRMAERLRAELDDAQAVDTWLWRDRA